ncbi:MAG: polysaccharide biosynthesis C-terminal domain-containing protein [Bacteroidales bacterium]|nr:polysaccharide biosynthesis C-terminal domain-containing protein [Bacteroidales bacterium]
MRIFKKIAGDTIIYGLGTIVSRLLNYTLLTAYYTRQFSIESYGEIQELYSYIAFLLVLLTFGLETGFFRFGANKGDLKGVFSTIMAFLLCTSSLFMISVYSSSESIAGWIDYEGNRNFIILIGAIVAVDAFNAIPFALLRLQNKAKKFSILKFVSVVVNIILVLGYYEVLPRISLEKFQANTANITFILVANLITSGLTTLFLTNELRIFSFKSINWITYKKLMIYSLPLMISGLAGIANETLDRAIMKHVLGEKGKYYLGIYAANYKVGMLLGIFIQMFRFSAEPFFFNYYKNDDSKKVYADVMRIFIPICMIIVMGIVLYLDYIKYFVDSKFHEGLRIVPIVLASYMLYGIFFNLSIWYKLKKLTYYGLIFTCIGATITIVFNLWLVPMFGYEMAAWGHVSAYSVMVVLSFFVGRKYYRINYNILRITEYIMVSCGLMFVTTLYDINDNLEIIANFAIICGYCVYLMKREKFDIKKIFHGSKDR